MTTNLLIQIKEALEKAIDILDIEMNVQYKPKTDELAVYHNAYSTCLFIVEITQENLDYINNSIQRIENEQRTN